MAFTFTIKTVIIIVAFWAAECLAFPIFIRAQWPKPCKKSFVWKMISALIFVAYGAFLYFTYTKSVGEGAYTVFAKNIMIGLILGMGGDLFLHIEGLVENPSDKFKGTFFVIGLLSFLAGHVFYIIAFLKGIFDGGKSLPYWVWIGVAVLLVIIALAIKLGNVKLGIAVIPVALYALTISTMLMSALTFAYYYTEISIVPGLIISAGAILFVISDGTIVFTIFGDKKAKGSYPLKVVNLTTYFIAQMLLASSIILVNAPA